MPNQVSHYFSIEGIEEDVQRQLGWPVAGVIFQAIFSAFSHHIMSSESTI